MKEKVFTIPNILSVFRILLIPFIIWAYFLDRLYFMAGLIVLSGVTDVVDGIIARKFNMVTSLGKALDPVADKLTLLALLVLMCNYLKSLQIIILCGIFVAKELTMGIEGLIVIKKTGTTYSANGWGKATTVILYTNILIHVLWRGIVSWLSSLLIYLSILFVCISLGVYTKQNMHRIKSCDNKVVND